MANYYRFVAPSAKVDAHTPESQTLRTTMHRERKVCFSFLLFSYLFLLIDPGLPYSGGRNHKIDI